MCLEMKPVKANEMKPVDANEMKPEKANEKVCKVGDECKPWPGNRELWRECHDGVCPVCGGNIPEVCPACDELFVNGTCPKKHDGWRCDNPCGCDELLEDGVCPKGHDQGANNYCGRCEEWVNDDGDDCCVHCGGDFSCHGCDSDDD